MSSLSHISLGLALLVVGITLVVANPLASSGKDTNTESDEASTVDISSNELAPDMSRGSANNNRGPLLDKALQRASYRLSQLSSDDYLRDLNSLRDRIYLVRPFNRFPFTSNSPQSQASPVKRMQCISGLPGGDCENSFLGGESLGQDFLRPGGRNPGRR